MTPILRKTIAPNGKQIFIQLHRIFFSNFLLLPKAETCFTIIAASFMNEFIYLICLLDLFISTDAYFIKISEEDGQLQSAGK